MREDLLGYLLGALDEEDQRRIEEALAQDESLRRQLEEVAAALEPMEDYRDQHLPPDGLAESVSDAVAEQAEIEKTTLAPASATQFGVAEVAMMGGVCLAIAFLFFPAILHGRHQSQVNTCQFNLQQLGVALTNFSDRYGTFPKVAESGPRSAAGIYAPLLFDAKFIENPEILSCPGDADSQRPVAIPTLSEIDSLAADEIPDMHRSLGGSYGYNLGYIIEGKLVAVKNLRRTNYAIMADAPRPSGEGIRSYNHSGRGQNVLFEDLCIRFIASCQEPSCRDQFFVSDRGMVEAGMHQNDAVVAASGSNPIPPIYLMGR